MWRDFASESPVAVNVFSGVRTVQSPRIAIPRGLKLNARLKMDGLKLLAKLPSESIPVAFFDPPVSRHSRQNVLRQRPSA